MAHDKKESEKLKIVIFLGSAREGRLGERVSKFVMDSLADTHDCTLLDPIEMDLPVLQKPLHFYPDKSKAPPQLIEANETVKEADAFLFISCEYNHCIPPALSNMVDHFPTSSFMWRPSGLITYSPGIFGGMRCAMQLRALTGEIGCLSVSNIFAIPEVHTAIDENGNALNAHMDAGLTKLMTQLDWNAKAMKYMREKEGTPQMVFPTI